MFLVTFAAVLAGHEDGAAPPKALEGVTREQIRDAVLDAVANPAALPGSAGGRPRSTALSAIKLVVFLEMPLHFHVALKLSAQSRFLPLKLALREKWFRHSLVHDSLAFLVVGSLWPHSDP